MKELLNFINTSNNQSFNSELDDETSNFAVVDTTTINPNTPPPGYKIETVGYGNVTGTPDKQKPKAETTYIDGKPVSLVDPKANDYIPFNEEESTNLYEINLEHIGNINQERSDVDYQISAKIFTRLNRLPVINKKQYTLAEIETIYKDPKQSDLQRKITEQARKLYDNPELNPMDKWELMMLDLNGVMVEGKLNAATKKFHGSLLATASYADARRHAVYHDKLDPNDNERNKKIKILNDKKKNKTITKKESEELYRLETGANQKMINDRRNGVILESHSFLFKEDGTLKTFDEFAIDYINKNLPAYNAQAKEYENRLVAGNQSRYTINEKGERVANNMYKMKEQQEAATWNWNNKVNSLPKDKADQVVKLLKEGKTRESDALLEAEYKKLQESRDFYNRTSAMIRQGQGKPVYNYSDYAPKPTSTSGKVKQLETATKNNWHVIVRDMGRGYSLLGDEGGLNMFNYNNLKKNYDQYLTRIREEYNYENQPTAFKLAAEIQTDNKFNNNKGGEVKGTKQSFMLDLANPIAYQETVTVYDQTTGEEKVVTRNIPTPGAKQFIEMYQMVKNDQGDLRYSVNGIGEVPTTNTDRDPIMQLLEATLVATTKRNENGSIKGVAPRGTVTFQGVVAGQTEYHAFNIKFNEDFLNQKKFKGTEEKAGLLKRYPNLLTEGITIYVPRHISEKSTTLGQQNYNSRTTSNVEALISLNGKVDIELPNSGSLSIQKNDKDQAFDVNGYMVTMNPDNLRMDTSRIETYQIPYSATYDIDQNVNNIIKGKLYENFMFNNLIYTEILKRQGEKDPNKLMLRVPYAQPQQ